MHRLQLCQQVGETPHLFSVLMGLYQMYTARAEHATARELGEQMLTEAQKARDLERLMEAHAWIGANAFFRGEALDTLRHTAHALSLYDAPQRRTLGFRYGYDSEVLSLVYKAVALWFLGYPDQADQELHAARLLAQEVSHPYSLVLALNDSAWFHQFRQETQPTREWAEAEITYATEHGIPIHLAMGVILRGWAVALQGQGEEGIAQIRQGLADFQTLGGMVLLPQFLGMLAQAHGATGQSEAGLRTVAEALAQVEATGERLYEAELYRLKGELLLQSGAQSAETRATEAEACFQHAMTVAQRQSGKSWELRAATSLARLWQQQEKTTEARDLLTPVYAWFTEGFDTADLKDAKSLLEELSEGV